MKEETLIYNAVNVKTKITRLSYEILEDYFKVDEIHLIGIKGGGILLANLLAKSLKAIKKLDVVIHEVTINKKNPLKEEISLSIPAKELTGKSIILVDDVSNTGRTLFYALQPLMLVRPNTLKVAVLADRKHKKFPIHCDYVGNSLSTTMKEHIDVVFEGKKIEGIYLS